MQHQVLSPRVQDGHASELGVQLRLSHVEQRLTRCSQQLGIEHFRTVQRDLIEYIRDRENNMKVRYGKNLPLPSNEPSFTRTCLTTRTTAVLARAKPQMFGPAVVAHRVHRAHLLGPTPLNIADCLALERRHTMRAQVLVPNGTCDLA